MSYLCNNIIHTEDNFTVLNSGYLKWVRPSFHEYDMEGKLLYLIINQATRFIVSSKPRSLDKLRITETMFLNCMGKYGGEEIFLCAHYILCNGWNEGVEEEVFIFSVILKDPSLDVVDKILRCVFSIVHC